LMACEVAADKPGNIVLEAEVKDARGNVSRAGTGFWASGDGDAWFEQDDRDRMEITPARREYQAGQTARLTVHTPFREATALIAVEREGVLETFVRTLRRHDPVVEIPVRAAWGPNVYVSVLAVRGRLREVPWYSFLQWGWRSPAEWIREYRSGIPQPTAMVDLARPGFKFGLTELQVGKAGAALKVTLDADKAAYAPRDTAKVRVRVVLPDGKAPPAGSEVAFAAVDRALLELSPNPTWDLLEAMRQAHPYLIETATAQMQVVGKRHFGKKALPAGGGGGKLSTRELFDTLLYWNPRVKLDARGEAVVNVPLNDALTAFRLVAIADVGAGWFGTGDTEIVSRQDLQITSGIAPYLREGDRYRAGVTLRNGTARAMQVTLAGHAGPRALSAQTLRLAAGEAGEVAWQLQAPEGVESLDWQVEATEQGGKAADRIRFTQKIAPRVPVTVQQSTFLRLEKPFAVAATPPAGALPGKGGIEVTLSASLAGQTTELRRYFERYPFSCLEQRVSVAVGLRDRQRWLEVAGNLQGYLDARGFAQYFPGAGEGSDALTAHLLSITHAAGFAVPEAPRQRIEQALADFVAGKVTPEFVTPRDLLPERRLHALEALARIGKADPRMLGAFEFKPRMMPTASLIDWYSILYRVQEAPEREARLAAVQRELRNRLRYAGGRLVFTTERDDRWWWLMTDGEVNALRLLETAIDDPAWQKDLPALMRGAMLRQARGHWGTTTANVWGALALDKFGRRFEAGPVGGKTSASLMPSGSRTYTWKGAGKAEQGMLSLPWPAGVAVDKPASFALTHSGEGQPRATLTLKAAVPGKLTDAGYTITRSLTPVAQKVPGRWSRGDVVRVRVSVESAQAMSWVVLSDPTPGGAAILGNTARDSQIAQEGENDADWRDNAAWPAFTERGFGFFRAYFEYVPKGRFQVAYTVRLNNAGDFALPATRVEAMYAPEVFGEAPNPALQVSP
ncbi:MAG: alpha-2-macroglobulin, partial [Methylobacterium sp.]|nr:alpha-2-macroglobulin [Methylobacterium sp.]